MELRVSVPLVSVVTPFYNTREYLAECIESVLRQTFQDFEYILVDNCSTDGSSEIAQEYARRYPGKIRLLHTDTLLCQTRNYNFALRQISPSSTYCKMVQADDWIFPECLEQMVRVAESDPEIRIVSAYRLRGDRVLGDGLPIDKSVFTGREVCRLQLMDRNMHFFGSQTTVLYRNRVIRESPTFFDEAPLKQDDNPETTVAGADTDACYRVLERGNFGFVHQVLSYSRTDNTGSMLARMKADGWYRLDALLHVLKFGPMYLEAGELASRLGQLRSEYFRFVARRMISGGGRAFWNYHVAGLKSGGQTMDVALVFRNVGRELLSSIANPGSTARWLWSTLRGGRNHMDEVAPDGRERVRERGETSC